MLKEQENSSGKLASKSKNMTKASGKKQKNHQIACLGKGSVIGLEDIVVAKSDYHVTSLQCLSMVGELYRVDKEFFMSRIQNNYTFMRKLEKQCLENVRDQVRKIAFVKQKEEK